MQLIRTNVLHTLTIIQVLLLSFSNAQQCSLGKADIESRNHVFFIDNHLMRQSTVPSGSSLRLACNGKVDTVHTCQNGVLNPALSTYNCADRLKPEILSGQSPDCVSPATLYKVGFRSDTQFTELYRACYVKANVQPMFVQHTVYRNAFATNRPEDTFTTDRVISGADALTFGAKSVHDRFVALLGGSQAYTKGPSDIIINRGHLAPSADFLFIENKRATFKYINTMPQFATINNGNWRTIEKWVQDLNRKAVNVKTGTIGVLELPHSKDPSKMVPIYLGSGTKNPIPLWTYKIVDNDVFVTYNNPFATDLPSKLPCKAVKCPAIGLKTDFRVGYTYCCSINSLPFHAVGKTFFQKLTSWLSIIFS